MSRRPLAPAVVEVVKALNLKPEDLVLGVLAEQYAEAIDEMATAAERAGLMIEWDVFADEDGFREQLWALQKTVQWKNTLVSLGPRLLATLEAMGASPKARKALAGALGPAGQPSAPAAAPKSELDRQREARQRLGRGTG